MQTIERIQTAAARFVSGDYQRHHGHSSVTAMLNRLEWNTLETRRHLRDHGDATMFFKIFHGQVNIPLPPIIMAADNQTRCLHHYKLWVIPSACLLYQNTFYVRYVPIWNCLYHFRCNQRPQQHSRCPSLGPCKPTLPPILSCTRANNLSVTVDSSVLCTFC